MIIHFFVEVYISDQKRGTTGEERGTGGFGYKRGIVHLNGGLLGVMSVSPTAFDNRGPVLVLTGSILFPNQMKVTVLLLASFLFLCYLLVAQGQFVEAANRTDPSHTRK